MAGEMIERVAHALHGSWDPDSAFNAETWESMARAAIEAMLEPSREMLRASRSYRAKAIVPTGPATYRAMIDAALSGPAVRGEGLSE